MSLSVVERLEQDAEREAHLAHRDEVLRALAAGWAALPMMRDDERAEFLRFVRLMNTPTFTSVPNP